METPFFRPEVDDAQRQQWLGNIRLIRPVSTMVLTGLALVAVFITVLYLCLGHTTRKARVQGYLVPDQGVIRLVAPQSAVVAERHAVEGQVVHDGDVLFVLAIDSATPGGDTQAAVQRSLNERTRSLHQAAQEQSQLAAEQRNALIGGIADMKRELAQIDNEVELHRQRESLAMQTVAQWETLLAGNYCSSAQVQTKNEELLSVQAQQRGLDRQRVTLQRQITALVFNCTN